MKKLPVILNAVLFVAIVVLYILYFTGAGKEEQAENKEKPVMQQSLSGQNVVFVEFDTILANYDMYIDLQGKLADKQKKSEAQLTSKSDAWQKAVTDYQNKANKGLVTRSQMMEIEAQLSKDQQNLIKMRDDMAASLAEEKQVTDRQVMYSILEYLEKYNKDKNYQFIFSKSFGGNLLLADPANEITTEVLKGLNEEYRNKQGSK